jgi:hypothetical protein
VDDRRKLILILAIGVLVLSLCYAWFHPVRSEPIYGDYTTCGNPPRCDWRTDPHPMKGGHAYYNIFGVELYREWEWIS